VFITNGTNKQLRVLVSIVCLEEAMDEVMDWFTVAPELLHHCLNLGVEGSDVTFAFSDELVQVLKVTADQGYHPHGYANLTFLEDSGKYNAATFVPCTVYLLSSCNMCALLNLWSREFSRAPVNMMLKLFRTAHSPCQQ
jgi:hypothetical protein